MQSIFINATEVYEKKGIFYFNIMENSTMVKFNNTYKNSLIPIDYIDIVL